MYCRVFPALVLVLLCYSSLFAQAVLTKINQATFDNYANNYNYTYWQQNWKTSGADRSFVNHSSKYALDIDFSNLTIQSLLIDESPTGRLAGFHALHSSLFATNEQGALDYAILLQDSVVYPKSNNPTNMGNKDSQIAEYGVWRNTRFVSANHQNNAPLDPYFSGIEFSSWHDRLKLTYHIKPTADLIAGQLKFVLEIPAAYTQYYSNNDLHAYGLPNNKGFAIKAGEEVDSITVVGNQLTIYSEQKNLLNGTAHQISFLLYAITDNLSTTFSTVDQEEDSLVISATQVAPNNSIINDINYDANQGIHYIKIPRVNMGYFNCSLVDRQQRINFSVNNPDSLQKKIRLCIFREPNINVTGFNSIVCNANGDPSGLPLQISKNWHTTIPQLFSGSWIREYTEMIIPANTRLDFQYKSTGAKWGETYSASSHQLCVAGAGVPRGGWLEAALGTFGESITHSPDYEYGNTNGADIRPFLVTNQAYGGNSSPCGWTGNVGGVDMFVYEDGSNNRRYQSQVKTDFKKYSPNLTETSISALSSDQKLKFDYSFYLNRSDDFTRIYYKVKIKALDNANFGRFDIFQLGGDRYNIHNTQQVVYGNDTGAVAQFLPTNNGSNNYTTSEIALLGNNPWLWAGDGLSYTGATSGIDIDCNNAMIIRDYHGVFNGMPNDTPYVRERSSSIGFSSSQGTNPTSYCLVPPAGIQSFTAGDSIELLVEVLVLPKQLGDYYGPNQNFVAALTAYGNSYELALREARQNQIIAQSPSNTVKRQYPLTVAVLNDEAIVDINGGVGYMPLVFEGLSEVDDPQLWLAEDSCWQLVDQSVHGKDFWQVEYNENTASFDLIFNVNQDRPNDAPAFTRYYLGDNPPALQIIHQSNISSSSVSDSVSITVFSGIDSLTLSPLIDYLGVPTADSTGGWSWTGPNGFIDSVRTLHFFPVDSIHIGQFIVQYTAFGCSVTDSFNIVEGIMTKIEEITHAGATIFPNPANDQLTIQLPKSCDDILVEIYDNLGRLIQRKEQQKQQSFQINISQCLPGNYNVLLKADGRSTQHRLLIVEE